MRVLLDTNIVIHREANKTINEDIGVLFLWLDKLKYDKCIHNKTKNELLRYQNSEYSDSFRRKIESYQVLRTQAAFADEVVEKCCPLDRSDNDVVDTILVNEVFCGRADILITEDRMIHQKADLLGIANKVFYIESFVNKCLVENPSLVDYRIQSIKKEYFGNINVNDPFFDSLKRDYNGFEKWFAKKSEEFAYVCYSQDNVGAFLYLKYEGESENYSDIKPRFLPCRRLKVGTLKVSLNGYKTGERFIKIIIDNALRFKVDEIYLTIFEKTIEQKRLVRLFEEYGFVKYGLKENSTEPESVYVKKMDHKIIQGDIKKSFPYINASNQVFIVPIYPEYHTALFPDSILNNENPEEFNTQESYRNAISKDYICRSWERDIHPGDIIIFYRTGGLHKSVITTLGVAEKTITDIADADSLIELCRNRTALSDAKLRSMWDYNRNNRPFIVEFVYTYSFPKRINMHRLIEMGIIADVGSAPRGFTRITKEQFLDILKETKTNEDIIIN